MYRLKKINVENGCAMLWVRILIRTKEISISTKEKKLNHQGHEQSYIEESNIEGGSLLPLEKMFDREKSVKERKTKGFSIFLSNSDK